MPITINGNGVLTGVTTLPDGIVDADMLASGVGDTGWIFVSQIVASGASTIAFTNMVSGYDYMYVTGPLIGTTDNTDVWFHLGIAGPTYRSSGYLSGSGSIASGGTSTGTANTTEGMVNNGSGAVGNATDEGISFMETILLNPAGTTDTHFRTITSSRDASGVYDQCISGGMYNGAEAHTSIKYQFSGGTITGTMMQYRRSRT